MTEQHLVPTPPKELTEEWWRSAPIQITDTDPSPLHVLATKAAKWGWEQRTAWDAEWLESQRQKARDEELQACCEWLETGPYGFSIVGNASDLTGQLRAARLTKAPSLKVIRPELSYRELSKWRKTSTEVKLKVVPVLVVVRDEGDYGQVVNAVREAIHPNLGVVVEVNDVGFNTREVKSKWEKTSLEGLIGRFGKSGKAMEQVTKYVESASKQTRYGAKVTLLDLAEQGDIIAKGVVSQLSLS